jgi:hypothetical protein
MPHLKRQLYVHAIALGTSPAQSFVIHLGGYNAKPGVMGKEAPPPTKEITMKSHTTPKKLLKQFSYNLNPA